MTSQEAICPTLIAPSDLRMLAVVRTFVEAVCQARQVDAETINAIVLATGEAVTNIVRHAHQDRPNCPFKVQCQIGVNTVEITLTDQGRPFNFDQVPQLDPAELRVGGRGVYLMRALMDDIRCETIQGGGNRLCLKKRWPTPANLRDCG